LPGSSRWRLSPERISDQQSGQVFTGLNGLDDLPLARASVRQEFLRRGRRWRDQFQEETGRFRDQFLQVGDRLEESMEGWLEPEDDEEPWDGFDDRSAASQPPGRSVRRTSRPDDDDPWI
jgi:hypothetical protein